MNFKSLIMKIDERQGILFSNMSENPVVPIDLLLWLVGRPDSHS